MPALSYEGQFVEMVEAGLQKPRPKGKRIKRQTIRNFRKRPFKPGDTLYHYHGMRTKWCRKLGESVCTSVHKIVITNSSIVIDGKFVICTYAKLNKFARLDGFKNWEEMRKWWVITHKLSYNNSFTGQLIKW